jgi:hypothetical protein
MGIRILERIILRAGRGDGDEEWEKPEEYGGTVGSIRERHECILSNCSADGDM